MRTCILTYPSTSSVHVEQVMLPFSGLAKSTWVLDRVVKFPVRVEAYDVIDAVLIAGAPGRMMIDSGAFFSVIGSSEVPQAAPADPL